MSENMNCPINIEDIKVEPIEETEEYQNTNLKIEIEIQPEADYGEKVAPIEEVNIIERFKTETDVSGIQRIKIEPDDEISPETAPDVARNNSGSDVYRTDCLKGPEVNKTMFIEVEIKQDPEDKYSDPLPEMKDENKLYYHPQCEIITPSTSRPDTIHTCELCHRSFANRRCLNIHIKFHKFTCDTCGKNFKSKQDLITHFPVHSRKRSQAASNFTFVKFEDKFQCDICYKLFVTRSGLNKHRKVHGGNLYQCDICDKQFTEKGNLTCHKRIHTGEKPFQCPVCKRDFTQKSSLNSHIKNHSETKPFACSVCNKEFCKKRNLTIHEYIHSEVKPFKCDICHKQFSQVS